MEIVICGASGLIGQPLVKSLSTSHKLTLVGRDKQKLEKLFGSTHKLLTWNQLTKESLQNKNIIINLSGENIAAAKWTSKQKQKLLDSRLGSTKRIAHYCAELGDDSPRIFNANAISIYGIPNDINKVCDESSPMAKASTDFLTEVAIKWKAALDEAIKAGVNVTLLHFSVVLSAHGGALAKMLSSFKLGMGGVMGDGKQPFSWVSIDDAVRAIEFLIERPDATGSFNIVADEIVTQAEFAKTLAGVLHRPCFMHMPAKMVKLMFGQMGDELLLRGTAAKATRLKQLGFEFQYATLRAALDAQLK